jgi:hypothetical protein
MTRGRMGVPRRGSAPVRIMHHAIYTSSAIAGVVILITEGNINQAQGSKSNPLRILTFPHHVAEIRQASHPLQRPKGGRY